MNLSIPAQIDNLWPANTYVLKCLVSFLCEIPGN